MRKRKVSKADLLAKCDELRRLTGQPLAVRFVGWGKPKLVLLMEGGKADFSGSFPLDILPATSTPLLLERMEALAAGVGLGFATARAIVPVALDGFNPLPESASFCALCGALVAESGRTPEPVDLSLSHKCAGG